jgi:hypothetical protein
MWLIRAPQSLDGFSVLQVEREGSFDTLGPIYQINGGISQNILISLDFVFQDYVSKSCAPFSPAAILLGICKTVPASKHRKV